MGGKGGGNDKTNKGDGEIKKGKEMRETNLLEGGEVMAEGGKGGGASSGGPLPPGSGLFPDPDSPIFQVDIEKYYFITSKSIKDKKRHS